MHGDEKHWVDDAILTNWVSTVGANINEVEKQIAERIGVKYAVALSCGTAALHLATKLAGEKLYGQARPNQGTLQGHRVFCSDMTFDASINPVAYQHEEIGYNYRMSNIIAGIVRGQLPYLNEHMAQKKAIYERYKDGLADLPVKMNPFDAEKSQPNFWLSCMIMDDSSYLAAHSQEELELIIKRTGPEEAATNCDKILAFYETKETGHAAEAVAKRIVDFCSSSSCARMS